MLTEAFCYVGEIRCLCLYKDRQWHRKRGRMLWPHYIQYASVLAASSRVTLVGKVMQTGTIRLIKHASPWRAFSSGSQMCFPRAAADVTAADRQEWVNPGVSGQPVCIPVNCPKQPLWPPFHAGGVGEKKKYSIDAAWREVTALLCAPGWMMSIDIESQISLELSTVPNSIKVRGSVDQHRHKKILVFLWEKKKGKWW